MVDFSYGQISADAIIYLYTRIVVTGKLSLLNTTPVY